MPRVRGCWRGQGRLDETFDAPLPDEVLDAFGGMADRLSPSPSSKA
jgi:hypothetical protein